MNIIGTSDFAGSTMLAVRDTIRALHRRRSRVFDAEDFFDKFSGSPGSEGSVFLRLLQEGYIEPAPDHAIQDALPRYRGVASFVLTVKGGGLALASAAKPVRRATANRVLGEFLQRVEDIEQDDRYLAVIQEVVLFGSMLDPERDPVSDIDVAVSIIPQGDRIKGAGEHVLLALFHRDMGWGAVDPEEIPYLNETDVKKYLKSRKSSLSIHEITDDRMIGGLEGVEHRTLYLRGTGRL